MLVLESLLEVAFEEGIIVDAVIAESLDQTESLWRIRESLPEAQKFEGGSIKHDVSVPVSRVPEFIARGMETVAKGLPRRATLPLWPRRRRQCAFQCHATVGHGQTDLPCTMGKYEPHRS